MIDVGQTFRENEILLTGANGFLGKIIVALLLDRYPDFKHLHILIRPRKSLSPRQRFDTEVLQSPALKGAVEKFGRDSLENKVTVWGGDASHENGGLRESDVQSLAGRVALILNCAGLVEFFPPLDDSLRANVESVERLIGLARRLGSKLLHVSTCYVAGKADGLVEETEPILGFYPYRKGPLDASFDHKGELAFSRERVRKIYEASQSGAPHGQSRSPQTVERLVDLGRRRAQRWGWVNTYTYAKSIGEQVLAAQSDVEFTIVRPAIVESALAFPFPGWVEGGRTAAPLVLMALGGLKDWPVRRDIPLEVVPVDSVAGATLVSAALLLNGEHAPVYQLATADANPLWLGWLVELLTDEARRNATNGNRAPLWLDPLRRLRFLTEEEARRRRRKLERRLEHAQNLAGRLERVAGKAGLPGRSTVAGLRTALRTLSLQLNFREQVLEQYLPFILHHRYVFESQNIREAYDRITAEDREKLPWSPEKIDWDSYWRENEVAGIKNWIQPEAVREWAFRI